MFLADKWATRIFLGRLEFFSGNLTWHLNIFLRTTPEISTDLDELIRKNDSVSKFLRSSEILNCTQQNLRSCMGNLVVKNFQTHRLRNFEKLKFTWDQSNTTGTLDSPTASCCFQAFSGWRWGKIWKKINELSNNFTPTSLKWKIIMRTVVFN